MPKRQLDTAIANSMKSAASDSFADNIKMVDITRLKPHRNNFYSMSDIEILADDIERQGLKHNLVVCEDKDNKGSYFIISGHRRFKAIQLLIDKGRWESRFVPCFIDGEKTENEVTLNLIMLNATSRRISDSEVMKQYKTLEEVLKALEAEGKKFKGRMRDIIAEALKVSPAQIGKIENINNNAIEEIKQAVDEGSLSISTANEIAKLPETEQKELTKTKTLKDVKNKDVREIQKSKPQKEEKAEEMFKGGDYFESDLMDAKPANAVKPYEMAETPNEPNEPNAVETKTGGGYPEEKTYARQAVALSDEQVRVFVKVFLLVADFPLVRGKLGNDFSFLKEFINDNGGRI